MDGAELVVEAATETPELKFRLFADIDRTAGNGAILATNTSSISITEIAARTERPERVIGMHFMNPVPVMPLVEVIRGLQTADETVETVVGIAKSLGKTPVEVNDYPGFVSNRVLMPMINEACFCVLGRTPVSRSWHPTSWRRPPYLDTMPVWTPAEIRVCHFCIETPAQRGARSAHTERS